MTNLEIVVLLLSVLGDETWCFLDVDVPEWTDPKYGHQN